jgi:spore coat polysaccharide biosynthesis protein SpsF
MDGMRNGPVGAIVQARMSSRRLPGKVMRPLHGRPMLAWTLGRLARAARLEGLVVATSAGADDDPVAALCRDLGVPCVRGPLDDVAARFALALEATGWSAFARVSGDSPFIDPAIVDRAVDRFRAGAADVVTNVRPRTFPPGQSVEVVAADGFARMCADPLDAEEREHVTPRLYRRPDLFRIENLAADPPYPPLHMAVDTPEDWARAEACAARLTRSPWTYGLDELVALWPEA